MKNRLVYILLAGLLLAGCGPKPQQPAAPAPAPAPAQQQQGQASQAQQAQPSQPQGEAVQPAAPGSKKKYSAPPAMEIDPNKQYTATVSTSMGTIKIQLFAKEAPMTTNNFVFLSKQGFYDGLTFHRIIKTFMIQGGDPNGTGTGGPGYSFNDELPPKHSYDPGIVAMANAGPNTNGSQFFICSGADCKNLDQMPYYTQFGKVTEGLDVVQKIAAVPTDPEDDKPRQPVVIKSITIQ